MQLNTDRLHSQLILEEGLRLMAYDDATGMPVPAGGKCKGHLTVGVGHNLDALPLTPSEVAAVGHDGRTQPITTANAMLILDNDIAAVCRVLNIQLAWWSDLDEIRARSLVDMTFNMGVHTLLSFHNFLSYLHAGDFDKAASDLESTAWYDEVGSRAVRLAGMIRTGEDYTS